MNLMAVYMSSDVHKLDCPKSVEFILALHTILVAFIK